MRGVAGEQHAALAERLGDALMRHIEITMDDFIRLRRRKKRLHARLHAGIAQYVLFALRRVGRVDRAPKSGRTVGGDLEAIAPRARIGEIAAIAIAALAFEIERRGENDEALRPGEAFEWNPGTPPHGAAAAVGADQIDAAMLRNRARRPAHLYAHGVGALRHVGDFMIEQYF